MLLLRVQQKLESVYRDVEHAGSETLDGGLTCHFRGDMLHRTAHQPDFFSLRSRFERILRSLIPNSDSSRENMGLRERKIQSH